MRVTINGESHDLTPDTTLMSFLQKRGRTAKSGVAVAVNEKVVPAAEWAEYLLKDGDSILLIQATQGG